MKTRLAHIVEEEGLTKQQFAQKLGISQAAVTHILSGRNSPSLEIITKIATNLPQYNLRWLILGELPIHNAEPENSANGGTIEEPNTPANPEFIPQSPEQSISSCTTSQTRLIVCFPDNTFKEYTSQ